MAVRYFENFETRGQLSNQDEMDGIREAIRLNWLEMEYASPSLIERHAIRANIERLLQTLKTLRFSSPHQG